MVNEEWQKELNVKLAAEVAKTYREHKDGDYFDRLRTFPWPNVALRRIEQLLEVATDEDRPDLEAVRDGLATIFEQRGKDTELASGD